MPKSSRLLNQRKRSKFASLCSNAVLITKKVLITCTFFPSLHEIAQWLLDSSSVMKSVIFLIALCCVVCCRLFICSISCMIYQKYLFGQLSAGFSPEIFLHLVHEMNKCQLAKKITHGFWCCHKFTLGACHLVWIAVCTKSLNLHLVVWQWYKFTHGGSSLYQRYTWCSHQVCYTLARTLVVSIRYSSIQPPVLSAWQLNDTVICITYKGTN